MENMETKKTAEIYPRETVDGLDQREYISSYISESGSPDWDKLFRHESEMRAQLLSLRRYRFNARTSMRNMQKAYDRVRTWNECLISQLEADTVTIRLAQFLALYAAGVFGAIIGAAVHAFVG